ncbi:MAG: hypothetical protein MI867_04070 [Pseudomonadales bacterium]|nr:hypothetical protein [Pseudomonadales bacterium]
MEQLNRRIFLKFAVAQGICMTMAASSSPIFAGLEEPNKLLQEENKKRKAAKYIFNFSSPYKSSDYLTTPHAHFEIKELVEKYTNNNVYVSIRDNGTDGYGSPLANQVSHGVTTGALLSISNLSAKTPQVDLLNIPYWAANDQQYLKVFKSDLWRRHVLSKMELKKIRVLFPYVVGERTATTTKKSMKTIRKPEDFFDVVFRVPNSHALESLYSHLKAKPYYVPWDLCAKNANRGRFEALDPSTTGLYAGPNNLRGEIGIISETGFVQDGWVAIANSDFIDSMDSVTQQQFLESFEEIQNRQFESYQRARLLCQQQFEKLGTKIYVTTSKERRILNNRFGYASPIWDDFKTKLLGDDGLNIFAKMHNIATA